MCVCVCVQVSGELVVHADRSPGFQFHLKEVRKRMVGQETSDLLRYSINSICRIVYFRAGWIIVK